MTEQFSDEYRALIASDEMVFLQEMWKPAVGDWVYLSATKELGLVTGKERGWLGGDEGWTLSVFHTLALDAIGTYLASDVFWLPTLGELVRMLRLAKAEWLVELSLYQGKRDEWYASLSWDTFDADRADHRAKLAMNRRVGSDVKIAAAKLLAAVRRGNGS